MERTMKLLVFVGLLYSVCAQSETPSASLIVSASPIVSTTPTPSPSSTTPSSSSTTPSSNSTTPSSNSTTSVVPTPTSSVHMVTSTHVMNPTPTPKPPAPELKNYTVTYDNGSKVCLRMTVTLNVNTTYENTTGSNVTVHVPVFNAMTNHSFCTETLASLLLDWDVNGTTNYLNFTFHRNDSSWVADKVNYRFNVTEEVFPGFPLGEGMHNFSYVTSLFRQDDTNRNFNRSYLCSAERKLDYSGVNFTSVLSVMDLHVQAFDFKNSTSGEFDSAYNCNNRGNKIVPIAVGAALAGLVIVVLIAYLIGRLKRRNQGSYEALS